METVIIELVKIKKERDFYDQLLNQVPDFGDFFGYNLNAFWDYIDFLGGKEIKFVGYQYLADEIFPFIIKVIGMINEYNISSIKSRLSGEYIINVVYIEGCEF